MKTFTTTEELMLSRSAIAIAATVVLAAPVQAAPIYDYRLSLIVDMAGTCGDRYAMNIAYKPDAKHFGCNWRHGDVITGTFGLTSDGAGLADGVHRLGVDYFSLTIGGVVFDIADYPDFTIRGVYGSGCPLDPDPRTDTVYPPGMSMRLLVGGGDITGFCDSVRGPGGVPALQLMYREPYGYGFVAYDLFTDVTLQGRIEVIRIAEPASLALAGTALLGAAVARRRRHAA